MKSPTSETYDALNQAFDYFNRELFGSRLPNCLITMQRSQRTRGGYFAGGRFGTSDGKETTDEIALNPNHFFKQTIEGILSTLGPRDGSPRTTSFRRAKPRGLPQ